MDDGPATSPRGVVDAPAAVPTEHVVEVVAGIYSPSSVEEESVTQGVCLPHGGVVIGQPLSLPVGSGPQAAVAAFQGINTACLQGMHTHGVSVQRAEIKDDAGDVSEEFTQGFWFGVLTFLCTALPIAPVLYALCAKRAAGRLPGVALGTGVAEVTASTAAIPVLHSLCGGALQVFWCNFAFCVCLVQIAVGLVMLTYGLCSCSQHGSRIRLGAPRLSHFASAIWCARGGGDGKVQVTPKA